MVLERCRPVFGGRGLGDPQLHAVQVAAVGAGALLGVGDAPPGRHQVELAGHDDLLAAERVTVQRLALQEPGDGLQADVRMRGDVHAAGALTSAGPMWSTKHHGPTVHRPRRGSARRTLMVPTRLSRLWVISSTHAWGAARCASAGTSVLVTGPLIAARSGTE